MALPRSQIVDLNLTPYYHCVAKCVRGSFLCGYDALTKRDYTYRKKWIEDRLTFLAEVFAIKICAYAVMSNHFHVVLYVDVDQAKEWDHNEILYRWGKLFPNESKKHNVLSETDRLERIEICRERLMNLSWFMRCLNEDIARRSNEEEGCKGRFWAGRFFSQALLNQSAVLGSMVYVDLNPIRAGIANTPEDSDYTAIKQRILCAVETVGVNKNSGAKQEKTSFDNAVQPKTLMPFASKLNQNNVLPHFNLTLSEYLILVEYTGRMQKADKIGYIPDELPDILERIKFQPKVWRQFISNISGFSYAIGNIHELKEFGKSGRKRAFKGAGLARKYMAYSGSR